LPGLFTIKGDSKHIISENQSGFRSRMYRWSVYSPANGGEENSKKRRNAYNFY